MTERKLAVEGKYIASRDPDHAIDLRKPEFENEYPENMPKCVQLLCELAFQQAEYCAQNRKYMPDKVTWRGVRGYVLDYYKGRKN